MNFSESFVFFSLLATLVVQAKSSPTTTEEVLCGEQELESYKKCIQVDLHSGVNPKTWKSVKWHNT